MRKNIGKANLSDANWIEYIKVQWVDIHHSRRQDWGFIATVLLFFYGFFYFSEILSSATSESVESSPQSIKLAIIAIGIFVCVIGALIAWHHWNRFYERRDIIRDCEEKLKIYEDSLFSFGICVQGFIFLIYFLFADGWIFLLLEGRESPFLLWVLIAFVFLLGLVLYCWKCRGCWKFFKEWFRKIVL